MRDFEWQQADQFYDDLVGTLGTRPAARPTAPAPAPVYKPPGSSFRAGLSDPARLFDNIVHGGMEAASLLESENAEDEGSEWETVALPGSATPPERVPRHALVVRRALGEGRLACVQTLGRDVELPALYGLDGRIRPDVLIIVQRIQRVQRLERAPVVRRRRAIILERESEDSDLSFLRWSPATRAGRFPPRDKSAIGGRAFMEKIKGEGPPSDWVKRENAIVAELSAGNMPDNLLKWIKIDLTYTGKSGTLTGTVEVLPDYLAIGSNDDYVHVPLDPVSAQLIADRFDAILPTAKICHAIYLQTSKKNRINAIERDYFLADADRKVAKKGRAQTSTAAYLEHTEAIQARMKSAGISLGELVAGHKKDVVISKRLHSEPERVAFHGFYDSAEYPHEPCYENPTRKPQPGCNKEAPTLAHNRRFSDYAQGVRLVHPSMTINGKQKMVADVLADPVESLLLSTEGAIVPARIPKTVKPTRSNPVESDEATEDVENPEDVEYVEDLEAEQAPSASSVTIAAASGLGSERTVSPLATVSPQRQMNEVLDRELIHFARARVLAEWINRKFSATYDDVLKDAALMKQLDVSKDKALLDKLRPFPQNKVPDKREQLFTTDAALQDLLRAPTDAASLRPTLDLLHDYGVVLLPPPNKIMASISRVEAKLERQRFDTQSAAIEQRALKFKKDVGNKGILHHCVDAETIPTEMAAKAGLEVAKPVVALLRRIRERNKTWKAGTYPGHWWNDFSVDIFVAASLRPDGFWARDKMTDFFRALNAACEQDAAPGRFAWRAIYNDAGLAQDIDKLFGDTRMLHGVDGHGPGPRMHVHLDVRPLTVPFDATTGFWLDGSRVVLSPPTTTTATTSSAARPREDNEDNEDNEDSEDTDGNEGYESGEAGEDNEGEVIDVIAGVEDTGHESDSESEDVGASEDVRDIEDVGSFEDTRGFEDSELVVNGEDLERIGSAEAGPNDSGEAVPGRGRGSFRHDPLGGDPGDNVEVRWNIDAATTAGSTVDVVVHLHGYGNTSADFIARKATLAGVELVDSSGAVQVRASQPTLVLVPRGNHAGGVRWLFEQLNTLQEFDAFVSAGLTWFATSVLRLAGGSSLTRGRLTLMAHSGGGAGLSALLDNGVNPNEVVCFDSMYGGEGPIQRWAEARIASPQAAQSGLRVFYTGCSGPASGFPGGRWRTLPNGKLTYDPPGSWNWWTSDSRWHLVTTEVSARRLNAAVLRALSRIPTGSALASRYKVERTSVPHNDIPARYTPALLGDIAATLPQTAAPPPSTSRPACVANNDWLTNPPQKPGSADPPPPRPAG